MPNRLQKLSEIANVAANHIYEYSHSVLSKGLAVVGGTSAATHAAPDSWFISATNWLTAWPWMAILSYVAIVLLIIERGFIVWAWLRKHKRGEI